MWNNIYFGFLFTLFLATILVICDICMYILLGCLVVLLFGFSFFSFLFLVLCCFLLFFDCAFLI